MQILFLGTPQFAVPALQALLEESRLGGAWRVQGVVTQPDRPAGRGRKLTPPPIKELAREAGIPVYQPARLRKNPEALEILQKTKPDLIVVVAFGQILPADFFDWPRWGTLNVHASLLPKYRGAAPINHTLLNGERETGVTIMKIDEGMDTGDILTQSQLPIGDDMTAGELHDLLARQGAELLVETIPGYVQGTIVPQPQDHSQATYAPRLENTMGRIDWNCPATDIHNRIRAFNPWPTAYATLRGENVKIWRSQKAGRLLESSEGQPGEVLSIEESGILVRCGNSHPLALKELQLPARKRVLARDFVNGVGLRPGESFS